MLTIRLAREGRKNLPFYRVVLTEHTKPAKSWYKEVLGFYNPISHEINLDIEKVSKYVKNWAHMSSRVAKMAFNQSKDENFKKFIKMSDVKKPKKSEDKK